MDERDLLLQLRAAYLEQFEGETPAAVLETVDAFIACARRFFADDPPVGEEWAGTGGLMLTTAGGNQLLVMTPPEAEGPELAQDWVAVTTDPELRKRRTPVRDDKPVAVTGMGELPLPNDPKKPRAPVVRRGPQRQKGP